MMFRKTAFFQIALDPSQRPFLGDGGYAHTTDMLLKSPLKRLVFFLGERVGVNCGTLARRR